MTIRILTCHPALPYVLNRTAPMGMTVRAKRQARCGPEPLCVIDIESKIQEGGAREAEVLGAWLPGHVQYYGAQRVELDGRTLPRDEDQLRDALLTGKTGSRTRTARAA